jgi:hypothetical protein
MRKQVVLAALAAIVFGVGAAHAGPCNTNGKDAGSGPTPGSTGQTVGTAPADDKSHPPTAAMNNAAGDKAMSSQDTQKQQQGQPTAAQQAQGAKPTQTAADQGC